MLFFFFFKGGGAISRGVIKCSCVCVCVWDIDIDHKITIDFTSDILVQSISECVQPV